MTQRARKKDANHNALADALKAIGWKVKDTSRMGEGFPDIVAISPAGRVMLLEVKQPDNLNFTDDELRFAMSICPSAFRVWMTPEQALSVAMGID